MSAPPGGPKRRSPHLSPPPSPDGWAEDRGWARRATLLTHTAHTTYVYWCEAFETVQFVYFIKEFERDFYGEYDLSEPPSGPIKIGLARNPVKRLRGMQTGNSRHLAIICLLVGTRETEQLLHREWKDAHLRGEWFGCGYEHVIAELASRMSAFQVAAHTGGEASFHHLCEFVPRHVLDLARSEAA